MKSVKSRGKVVAARVVSDLVGSLWTYMGTNSEGQHLALWENVRWPVATTADGKKLFRPERSFLMVADEAAQKWAKTRFVVRGFRVYPLTPFNSHWNGWSVSTGYNNESTDMRASTPEIAHHAMSLAELIGLPIREAHRILPVLHATTKRTDKWMQKADRALLPSEDLSSFLRSVIRSTTLNFFDEQRDQSSEADDRLMQQTGDINLVELNQPPSATPSTIIVTYQDQLDFWTDLYRRLLLAVYDSPTVDSMMADIKKYLPDDVEACRAQCRTLVQSFHVRKALGLWPHSADPLNKLLNQVVAKTL